MLSMSRPVLIIVCSLALGYLGASLWTHRATIGTLYLKAAEQKYLIMAGETGPVTYLVRQVDYLAFESAALEYDGVLGVEVHEYPEVAAIAFLSNDVPAIAAINALPTVISMKKKFVPMICH